MAGQIAKLQGARAVGSAGSDHKMRALEQEYGFDAAFNYKNGPVTEQLAQAAPDGIDVFFGDVGGANTWKRRRRAQTSRPDRFQRNASGSAKPAAKPSSPRLVGA